MKKNLFLFISFLIGISSNAQRTCDFDHIHQEQLSNDPAFRAEVEQMRLDWVDYLRKKEQYGARPILEGLDTIYEIPVVVHVFHTGEALGHNYNKTDAAIQAWLDYTNEIYAGTAPGYVGAGAGGTVIPVRLVLAKRDVDCNPTTGIVRIDGSGIPGYESNGLRRGTTGTGATEESLKSVSRWDPSKYYNVYIVKAINGWDGYSAGSGVAGYAGFPSNNSNNYSTFLFSATVDNDDHTMAHEFGHSMGLYHTFEGADNVDVCPPSEHVDSCAYLGDLVCDTEIHSYNFGSCPSNSDINACTGSFYQGTQYNVMSYGNCSGRFTPGQSERAIFMLQTYRPSLLYSLGAVAPATVTPIEMVSACSPLSSSFTNFEIGPGFVGFGDINVGSQGAEGDGGRFYIDYTQELCEFGVASTFVNQGELVELRVGIVNINNQNVKAYLDYNNDGVFNETNERIFMSSGALAEGIHSHNVIIPMDAVLNTPLRLRVIADLGTISSACSDRLYGQTEDFAVTILDPLSENILSFDAVTDNCNVNLNWKVDDIKDVHYFEVQKSIDGNLFETIQRINSIQNENDYGIIDAAKINGTLLYRLAVHTLLEKVLYSKLTKVETVCNNRFDIYPNPSDGLVKVKYLSQGKVLATLKVIDVTGKPIVNRQMEATLGINEWQIELDKYASGAYIINVEAGNDSHRQIILKK